MSSRTQPGREKLWQLVQLGHVYTNWKTCLVGNNPDPSHKSRKPSNIGLHGNLRHYRTRLGRRQGPKDQRPIRLMPQISSSIFWLPYFPTTSRQEIYAWTAVRVYAQMSFTQNDACHIKSVALHLCGVLRCRIGFNSAIFCRKSFAVFCICHKMFYE